MRVALLTTNLQPDNGWATVTVRRGAALMALGVEVVALTAHGDAPPAGIAPTDVRPVLPRLGEDGEGSVAILASSPRIARATDDCDIVDSVCEPYVLGCGLVRPPLVVTAHGSYVPKVASRGLARGLYRRMLHRAHILAVSDYTARRVVDALGGPRPHVVLSGVDFDFYQPTRPRPEKRGPTVLSVGAIKKRKGIHVLLNAIALVRQSIPDIQCVLAGKTRETGYTELIRKKIDTLGLADHVQMTGHLPYEDIVGWYQAADVFAMPSLSGPSHFEGFGLVILEANACGLPAIGSKDSGNESAIADGISGYLVEQNNPQALAARIIEVVGDPARREQLSRGARTFAREHSWATSAAEVLRFYEDILAGQGA